MNMFKHIILLLIAGLFLTGCDDAPKNKLWGIFYNTFYIKVVDQNGQAVKDVESYITHGGNSAYVYSNLGSATYHSDSDGLIAVKVDSRQIRINKINKQDYSINLPKILFDYRNTRTFQVPSQGHFWPKDWQHYSKDKPFILPVWKIEKDEQLAACKNGRLRKKLIADGRSYGIDLLAQRRSVILENTPQRAIQISFKRKPIENLTMQQKPSWQTLLDQPWEYSITINNGGLQEIPRTVLYKKTPPTSGYTHTWRLDNQLFRGSSNEFGSSAVDDQRHFYLKLKDKNYARLSVKFQPIGLQRAPYNDGLIELNYSINTSSDNQRTPAYVRGFGRFDWATINSIVKDSCTDPG